LLVEDDHSLVEVLKYNLEQTGCHVVIARDGNEALRQGDTAKSDLILFDIMLPGLDGIEVCRQLRARQNTRNCLIVMLIAKSEEIDQLVGFSVGTDDYVTKPFSIDVLLQRVKALMRRQEPQSDERNLLVSQGISIDRRSHQATREDWHNRLETTVNIGSGESRQCQWRT